MQTLWGGLTHFPFTFFPQSPFAFGSKRPSYHATEVNSAAVLSAPLSPGNNGDRIATSANTAAVVS
jgi:hypothetical protein